MKQLVADWYITSNTPGVSPALVAASAAISCHSAPIRIQLLCLRN